MQWVALMVVGFLVLGLRRSTRATGVILVALVAAVLTVWFTQMGPK